jgi:hypothetical protein
MSTLVVALASAFTWALAGPCLALRARRPLHRCRDRPDPAFATGGTDGAEPAQGPVAGLGRQFGVADLRPARLLDQAYESCH